MIRDNISARVAGTSFLNPVVPPVSLHAQNLPAAVYQQLHPSQQNTTKIAQNPNNLPNANKSESKMGY